ncbi:MAG: segregation/condensation protein A [Synechococcales cyanobacterium C42_A2020_086]|jgi:segregation and condensation protein A|nr:segregation/condensation protein A [Synechococcales cyanobacterium M58_A2018_015]MBF2075417.1 segregation/condensation protein A [Synechococcales cyanobacterium C42_A2020_086]
MPSSLAETAIALLIDLAERGEINPWDVQVIEVIDRFLSKLQPTVTQTGGRTAYEAELSESGQAFLYASMLLLLKAESLARLEADQPDELPEGEEFLESESAHRVAWHNLEQQIRRRAAVPPVSRRRVTLNELIAQLNMMAAAMADRPPRRTGTRRPRPQSRTQAMRTIAQLAHEENLSEIAAVLEQFLLEHWQQISQDNDWLEFEQLLQQWSTVQALATAKSKTAKAAPPPQPTIHDRVGVFWALLFLSAQSKVELAQEKFYDDLKVRSLIDPAAVEASILLD